MNTYVIEFNEQQLNILNMALGEIPFKLAAPLVNHINQQLSKAHDKAKDEQTPSGAPAP